MWAIVVLHLAPAFLPGASLPIARSSHPLRAPPLRRAPAPRAEQSEDLLRTELELAVQQLPAPRESSAADAVAALDKLKARSQSRLDLALRGNGPGLAGLGELARQLREGVVQLRRRNDEMRDQVAESEQRAAEADAAVGAASARLLETETAAAELESRIAELELEAKAAAEEAAAAAASDDGAVPLALASGLVGGIVVTESIMGVGQVVGEAAAAKGPQLFEMASGMAAGAAALAMNPFKKKEEEEPASAPVASAPVASAPVASAPVASVAVAEPSVEAPAAATMEATAAPATAAASITAPQPAAPAAPAVAAVAAPPPAAAVGFGSLPPNPALQAVEQRARIDALRREAADVVKERMSRAAALAKALQVQAQAKEAAARLAAAAPSRQKVPDRWQYDPSQFKRGSGLPRPAASRIAQPGRTGGSSPLAPEKTEPAAAPSRAPQLAALAILRAAWSSLCTLLAAVATRVARALSGLVGASRRTLRRSPTAANEAGEAAPDLAPAAGA